MCAVKWSCCCGWLWLKEVSHKIPFKAIWVKSIRNGEFPVKVDESRQELSDGGVKDMKRYVEGCGGKFIKICTCLLIWYGIIVYGFDDIDVDEKEQVKSSKLDH